MFHSNDACRMSGQTRRFKDSRFNGEEDEEEIDGCVAGTAGIIDMEICYAILSPV